MQNENTFKTNLIKEIKNKFPGCMIFHLNPSERNGVPDLLILYKNKWATLEGKKSKNSKKRPHQNYYVDLMNKMSFSRFVYPENKEEVLNELSKAFRT